MAKIGARGAKAVETLDVPGFHSGARWVYVLASDGRVLRRLRLGGGASGNYAVVSRGTMDEGRRYLDRIEGRARRDGGKVLRVRMRLGVGRL